MLRILGRKNSINVIKVLWCAAELGLDFERVDVGGAFGGNDQPDYLAKNPMGRVPTIEDGDVVLWESHTIVRYLAEKHGAGTLWPADPAERAKSGIWMDWYLGHLHPPMTPIFWNLVRTAPEDRDMAAVAAAIEEGKRLWSILDGHLAGRDYVAGDRLTIGDIPVGAAAFRWYTLAEGRPAMKNLDAWYRRLQGREAYATHAMNELT